MKPVIIIAIAFVLLIPTSVFAQSSEESLGHFVTGMVSNMMKVFLILIIPALIILYLLKRKGELQGVSLKGVSAGLGLLFLGTIIIGMVSVSFHSDEENARAEAERKIEWEQEIAEIKAREEYTKDAEYNEKYADEIRLGIDPKSLENLKGLEMKFGNEWDDLDTLKERQRSGKITFNQKCQTIANLMNQNISDDYLYTFWNDAFLQECR